MVGLADGGVDEAQDALTGAVLEILATGCSGRMTIIATVTDRLVEAGHQVIIVTGDRDLFQLVDDERDIAVLYMGGGPYAKSSGPVEIRREGVLATLGVTPEEVVDLKALTGDTSDNIPGVKGVGPKTAINLLQAYGDLDQVYAAV